MRVPTLALAWPLGAPVTAVQGPARQPCPSCPYRLDVPSGIWTADEYDKLPPFDADTMYQPPRLFLCHQLDDRLCAGWVGCHDMDHTLAVRIAVIEGRIDGDLIDAVLDYVSPVPLWPSGEAAAEHGKADIEDPSPDAVRLIGKVGRRQSLGR